MNLPSSSRLLKERCLWTYDLSKNMKPNSLLVNLSGRDGVFVW